MLILNYIMKNYKISFRDLNYHGSETLVLNQCGMILLFTAIHSIFMNKTAWTYSTGNLRMVGFGYFWSVYQCLEKKVDNKHIYHDMKLEILFI